MSFAQNEAVASGISRISRINAQTMEIRRNKDVYARRQEQMRRLRQV
jgi:hypothetical protein